MSSRASANNAITKSNTQPSSTIDSTVSRSRYGVTIKRGNFRRAQEDRVSVYIHFSFSNIRVL